MSNAIITNSIMCKAVVSGLERTLRQRGWKFPDDEEIENMLGETPEDWTFKTDIVFTIEDMMLPLRELDETHIQPAVDRIADECMQNPSGKFHLPKVPLGMSQPDRSTYRGISVTCCRTPNEDFSKLQFTLAVAYR